jgi:UDP-N-acetylmuramoyl-tripeptide--D-alanyl-D-alanine ligase
LFVGLKVFLPKQDDLLTLAWNHMITAFSYSLSTILGILRENDPPSFEASGNVKTISTSSLECKSGSLFVPLRDKRDGHEFILDALRAGASYFLCETNHPILKKLSSEQQKKAILVKDTLISLGALAHFHRMRFRPLVIGVTGSSGKTSTKELLGNLFQFLPKDQVVVTEKNFNNEIGVPFTLFRINEKTKVVICEMGMNQRGEIERLSRMANPKLGLITNIGSAHIENLKSPENIALEKSDLMLGLQKSGVLFLPRTSPFFKLITKRAKKNQTEIIDWDFEKDPNLKILQTYPKGFLLRYKGEEFKWNLPGRTLLSNVTGVIKVGEHLNLSKEQIINAIRTYKAPDKRLNIKKSRYLVIDDSYNANPESMRSSIHASIQLSNHKPLALVLGTMKELGKFSKMYHELIGEELRNYPEPLLVTFGEAASAIAKKRKVGRNHSFPGDSSDIPKIVELIRETLPKGSTVLVKGSRSMKMERIVEALLGLKT